MLAKIEAIHEARKRLKDAGFFHATGLPAYEVQEDTDRYVAIQANRGELASWGRDDKWIVAVLVNGEVWLRAQVGEELDYKVLDVLHEVCSKGRRASVPLSTHEIIFFVFVARRFVNYRDDCDGCANPNPQPR